MRTGVMGLALMVMVVGVAARAHAQAPGEVVPVPVPVPVMPPVAGQPPPPTGVMADRWGLSLALAPESLTAQTSGAQSVGFTTVEIAARYRVRPWLETGLAVFAGGASSNDVISTGGLYADVRYRFVPERKWNGFVSLGVGAAKVAQSTAASEDQKSRGSFRLGVGGERRFGGLGVNAELRVIGIAQNTDASNTAATVAAAELARYGVGGLELALGATYYF